jgi:hypothetical protein
MDEKYCLYVGTQLTVFHAAKLFIRLNYVKSPFTKKKYESCKACNTWVSFHICKSFTKIFGSKNKSECIGGFSLNLPAVSVWLNMYDTNRYLHRSLQTRCNLWPDMSDLGRIYPTLVGRFWKMILFSKVRTILILVDHDTGCIGKLISLSFYAYEERTNRIWYTSCASI